MHRAALQATVQGVAEWDMTEATWQACMQYTVAGAEVVWELLKRKGKNIPQWEQPKPSTTRAEQAAVAEA